MRAISLVNKLEFQFMGNVARNAITLGDLDNDGHNELVIGNNTGEVSIFKGRDKVQMITNLSFVSCIAIGDVLNKKRNCLIIVTADGWCYIYDAVTKSLPEDNEPNEPAEPSSPGHTTKDSENSSSRSEFLKKRNTRKDQFEMVCIHTQRIPANAKNIVLGDIDNDGKIELILGLTDRVVRSYRWIDEPSKTQDVTKTDNAEPVRSSGRFVALNKWECANQIGSITLHHSSDKKPSLLIAQPGGTFMRIKCQTDTLSDMTSINSSELTESNGPNDTIVNGSSIDYQFLGISRMRNQNISTELLGDFKTSKSLEASADPKTPIKCPYAVATLDGTIMLVQDEIILWAIAVDHQIFALTKLDVTGNGADDIIVCSWDGQTYILDQEKNCVRFQLDEPVQAFHSGFYTLSPDEDPVTCLVYVTFKNTVILYYDIPLKELMCKKFDANLSKVEHLLKVTDESEGDTSNSSKKRRNQLIEYLLYNVRK